MTNPPNSRMAFFALLFLPAVMTAAAWPLLPGRIPIHWNAAGQVDGWGGRAMLFLLPAIALTIGLLVEYLPRWSVHYDKFRPILQKINLGFMVFFNLLVLIILYLTFSSLQKRPAGTDAVRLIPAALGIFLVFIGNLLPKLKRNRIAGVRTKWTLESDEVWYRTHRFCGWLMVILGTVFTAGALLVPLRRLLWLELPILAAMAIAPVVYSWRAARQEADRRNKNDKEIKPTE